MAEGQKGKKHKGAEKIAETRNNTYSTSVLGHTVMCYVANWMMVQSPLKMGLDGGIHKDVFKLLLTAFKTFVKMKQINGETKFNTTNLLSQQVNKMMNNLSNTTQISKRLLHASLIDFIETVSDPVEEQRMRWTMFNNWNIWFDYGEENLANLWVWNLSTCYWFCEIVCAWG